MKLYLHIDPKTIVESHTATSAPKILDEIDALADTIQANMGKEVRVPKDVLDSFMIKDTLNQDIWENDVLNPKVRAKLIQVAKDFYKDLDIPKEARIKDILFTGSLANFNWSRYSDIDLHIVLDFNEFDADQQIVQDYFYAHKSIWNQEHDITVFNYPVELYVQDINHKMVSSAIYSVLNDKWLKKPKRETFDLDKKAIKDKADKIIRKLRDIRQDYQDQEYQSVVDKVKKLKNKIKQMRNAGLEKGGEFSLENLVFKVLRRTPFMDQLDSFKAKAYDKLMSVTEALPINEETKLTDKQLIKERLRLLEEIKYSTKQDYYSVLAKMSIAKNLYGGDPYWEDSSAGDFAGVGIVNIHGQVQINRNLAPAHISKTQTGLSNETAHYMSFQVRAGRGIEHPDTLNAKTNMARTRGGLGSEEFEGSYKYQLPDGVMLDNGDNFITVGLPKPGSPASDAQIKIYLIYGDMILDFVEKNLKNRIGYNDGKSAQISKEKTKDEWQYKFDKYAKEKERQANKPEIKMDPDELAKREAQRAATAEKIAKLKSRMKGV